MKKAKRAFGLVIVFALMICGLMGAAVPAFQAHAAESESVTHYKMQDEICLGTSTENIYYSYRTIEEYTINPKLPAYISALGCGNAAGINIVAWYSRNLTNLIPGFNAGQNFLGTWLWSMSNNYTTTMSNQLYTDMGAFQNGAQHLVSINGYLNGLNAYSTRQGYNFTKSKVKGSGGALLNPSYKTALQNGQLMTIFTNGFNMNAKVTSYSGYDHVTMEEYAGAHIMAVYGYKEYSYYNVQNQLIQKDIYLMMYTGWGTQLSMIKLTSCTLDDAYITHIS